MLPRLMRARLDEAGIDFAVVYGTHGLFVLAMDNDELRRVVHRAFNMLYADMFADVADRLTPAALIPTRDPDEAVAELDYAVGELGLKTVLMNTMLFRSASRPPSGSRRHAKTGIVIESPAMDMGDAYDPVWSKCVELGVVPASHNAFRGPGSTHGSPSNYAFNSLGSLAEGGDFFCRSLLFGGVTKRFPALKFAFLEGGVGWAAQLYNSLFEYWEKRNLDALRETLDPTRLDIDLLVEMFEEHGNDYLTPGRIRANPHQSPIMHLSVPAEELDDFGPAGISRPEDIRDIFATKFFFGCEADDRLNAVAFDTRINHYDLKLNAVLGSDIGHWDTPDMTRVMVDAYRMMEDGLMNEADFRAFTFGNAVAMHGGMNPDFFKGTAVEDAVEAATPDATQ
jgi:predicted TIM-barrel fold metal-dependent hydrolase